MGRTWVLDSATKGTGANVVPLEKLEERDVAPPRRAERPGRDGSARPGSNTDQGASSRRARTSPRRVRKTVTALAPGQVRKKATGEIGSVRSVDPKAGTAVVHWLRRGDTSTVPLSAITRR